jgi:hypothetical protein
MSMTTIYIEGSSICREIHSVPLFVILITPTIVIVMSTFEINDNTIFNISGQGYPQHRLINLGE